MSADETPDLSAIVSIMEDRLADKGVGPAGVYWRDRETMNLRFDQILAVCQHEREPFTVNDLGCGYGALYTRLRECALPVAGYTGYDISARMLEAAARHVADPAATFVQAARLDRHADYSFACGIINMPAPGVNDEAWTRYVESVIRDLAAWSRRGFAINSLSTYVDFRQPNLYYGDPLYFFDFCKRHIARRVSLLHDADNWEWTLFVRQ
jgi:SAM-dependent methyltransferase